MERGGLLNLLLNTLLTPPLQGRGVPCGMALYSILIPPHLCTSAPHTSVPSPPPFGRVGVGSYSTLRCVLPLGIAAGGVTTGFTIVLVNGAISSAVSF